MMTAAIAVTRIQLRCRKRGVLSCGATWPLLALMLVGVDGWLALVSTGAVTMIGAGVLALGTAGLVTGVLGGGVFGAGVRSCGVAGRSLGVVGLDAPNVLGGVSRALLVSPSALSVRPDRRASRAHCSAVARATAGSDAYGSRSNASSAQVW